MLNEHSWFRITAGQKDYAERMILSESPRNDYYAKLKISPGPLTAKGIWGEPENTRQALTNRTLGNYYIPNNWPQPPVKNEPGRRPQRRGARLRLQPVHPHARGRYLLLQQC